MLYLMKELSDSYGTAKYPTFMEVTLWKIWDPSEASRGKSLNPCSTIILALEISDHNTGMPVN